MNTAPLPAPAAYRFDVASRQSVGAREAQEDSFRQIALGDHGLIAIVADGMGGHVGGATASRHVCDAVETELCNSAAGKIPSEFLTDAIHAATISLADNIRRTPDLDGMGSTLVAAHISGQQMHWASVGDSLLYLFRNGRIRRLNEDHSMAPMLDKLVGRGEMSHFEARYHPQRHALRSAITGYEVEMTDVPEEPIDLLPGDWVLLASDGLDTLTTETLATLMTRFTTASAEKMASALIDAVTAEDAQFQDNTTLIAIAVTTDELAPGTEAAA